MTLHERALQAGMAAARRVAGDVVTVTRGATTITVNRAVQTNVEFESLDGSGAAIIVEAVEWLIKVSDYTLGTPAAGDIITRVLNGTSYAYTVEQPTISVNVYDYSDSSRTQYLIRSREDGGTAYVIGQPSGFALDGSEQRY